MPADLVPHEAIPELAARVTPEMLKVLRLLQREGFILNGRDLDPLAVSVLRALADLGLVDPGYDGAVGGEPYMWISNGNGSRVLGYKTGVRSGPHYEVPSSELAAWLEQQGPDRWWNVDGDPLLTGRLTFPCPTGRLAEVLRQINRPLIVQAKKEDADARGQPVGREKLDAVAGPFAESLHLIREGEMPAWSGDRVLYVCWKGSPYEWLLAEDGETTAMMRADERARGADAAAVTKE